MELPYNGEWHRASQPRFRETILFVHHYGGRVSRRHLEFVNDLGFNAVTFELNCNNPKPYPGIPITADLEVGMIPVWRNQVERMLNLLPGPKIIFAFSAPSSSSLMAVSRREARDVTAVVCDSGPFFGMWLSTWNMLGRELNVKNKLARAALSTFGLVQFFGYGFVPRMHEALAKLPPHFPVLSIRGWRDPLVPYNTITQVFEPHPHLDLEVLALPEAAHLDGLKVCPEMYMQRVGEFIASKSTAASPL